MLGWLPSWWPFSCFFAQNVICDILIGWGAWVIGSAAQHHCGQHEVSQSYLVGLCAWHSNDAANSFGDGFLWHNVELPNMSWATQVSAEIPSSGEWQMWYAASSLSALMDCCLGKGGGGDKTDALLIRDGGGGAGGDKTNSCTTDWGWRMGGEGDDKKKTWCTTD